MAALRTLTVGAARANVTAITETSGARRTIPMVTAIPRGGNRAHRRRAAVRRGSDAAPVGAGRTGGIHAIPPTLQQSLTARLDRLGPAREVAQIGAVIGRDFSYALLRAVAGIEDTPLQMSLERLAEADIPLVQGLPPSSDYRFKHALIQDADAGTF